MCTGSTYIVRVTGIGFLFAGLASAAFTCGTGQVLITGSATSFCVSDSGYSNAWFSTNPPNSPTVDFNLLGDSAQFLIYTTAAGSTVGEWLSPTVAGNPTGTGFTTSVPVSNLSPVEAASTISDGTVRVAIDSTVIANNIKQTFMVTNIGSGTIVSMELVDYFHYFPYGSSHPTQGTLSYQPVPTIEGPGVLGLWAEGTFGTPGFVRDGGACGGPGIGPFTGCSTPDHFIINTPANVLLAVGNSATTPLPGGQTTAAMDSAGALSWSVTGLSLTNGQSQGFTIELVPEPATFGLILIGGIVCLGMRRKR